MSRYPFRRLGLVVVLLAGLAGCPGPGSTPAAKPSVPEASKPARDTAATPRMTAPEHIPGG